MFRDFYERLQRGDTGVLPERELEPVQELPGLADLPVDDAAAEDALTRLVVIKLNGGLGTSMGPSAERFKTRGPIGWPVARGGGTLAR